MDIFKCVFGKRSASGRRLSPGSCGQPMNRRLRRLSTPLWCGQIGCPQRTQAQLHHTRTVSKGAHGRNIKHLLDRRNFQSLDWLCQGVPRLRSLLCGGQHTLAINVANKYQLLTPTIAANATELAPSAAMQSIFSAWPDKYDDAPD